MALPEFRAEFKRARPHWEKVQQGLRARLGNKRWNKLLNLTNEVTHLPQDRSMPGATRLDGSAT